MFRLHRENPRGTRRRTPEIENAAARIKLPGLLLPVLLLLLLSAPALTLEIPAVMARDAAETTGTGEEGCTWYFAEGTTRGGFEEWLTLFNPGPDDLIVTVNFLVSEGTNRERIYSLPSHTRLNVYVNQEIGSEHDVGMKVFSSGFYVAERSLYFNYGGKWTGGHNSPGTLSASTRWYFAEGTTRESYENWICMLNPGEQECRVDMTMLCSDGEGIIHSLTIPAGRRSTININELVGINRDFTIRIDSDLPVVAERPVYFLYLGTWPGGHDVMGAASLSIDWYFAQGLVGPENDTWLCLANPGDADARVTVDLIAREGACSSADLFLPAYSRLTAGIADLAEQAGLAVPAGMEADFAIHVQSSAPIVAERSMYFADTNGLGGGSCTMGSASLAGHSCLAGGSTRPGFVTRLHIVNFSDLPATATLDLFCTDGTADTLSLEIPATSFLNLDLGTLLHGKETDVSCELESDPGVLMESSVLFVYHDVWTGGDAVMAVPVP